MWYPHAMLQCTCSCGDNEVILILIERPGAWSIQPKFPEILVKTEWIGSVQPEKFRKKRSTFRGGPLFSVGPFHLTIRTHSQFQDLAIRYLPCTKWRKILITALLWIVNSRSIGVTHTSMYSYDRSVVASQAKCMFWLLTALKDDLFPERICNVLFVIRFEDFD